MEIVVEELFAIVEYDYPIFHLNMQCYWCQIVDGTPILKEHESARWLDMEHIDDVAWLPADQSIISRIKEEFQKGR